MYPLLNERKILFPIILTLMFGAFRITDNIKIDRSEKHEAKHSGGFEATKIYTQISASIKNIKYLR